MPVYRLVKLIHFLMMMVSGVISVHDSPLGKRNTVNQLAGLHVFPQNFAPGYHRDFEELGDEKLMLLI